MSNVAARLKGILVVVLTASALCLVQAPAIADDATAPAAPLPRAVLAAPPRILPACIYKKSLNTPTALCRL
jgi:hypothetical protein